MKFIFFIITIISFYKCSSKNETPLVNPLKEAVSKNTDTDLAESSKYYYENSKVEFGSPISFKSSKNIAIPIILGEIYEDKGAPKHSFFNIAVIDSSNSIKKLLFENSVIITEITTFEKQTNYEEEYHFSNYNDETLKFSSEYNSLIFMLVQKFKNRKKGQLELFVYNIEEDKLTLLSPENSQVIAWNIFNEQSKVLIRYQKDSNSDGFFNYKDDENIAIVDPKKNIASKGLFDIEKLREIKINVAKEN